MKYSCFWILGTLACQASPAHDQSSPGVGQLFELEDAIALLAPNAPAAEVLLEFPGGGRNGLSFAPDSRRFAYASNHDAGWRLHIGDTAGGSERAGNSRGDFILDVEWAPEGEWIAWQEMGARVGTGGVHLLEASTGEQRSVTEDGAHDGAFDWFPDSERLALAHTLTSSVKSHADVIWVERRSALEVYDLGLGSRRRLLELEREIDQVAVAPDGSHVLYITGETLWKFDLREGAEPKQVMGQVGNHVQPAFSPDGIHVACVLRAARDNNKGSDDIPVILGREGSETHFARRPLVSEFAWSPSGEELALTDSEGIHVLDLGGGETKGSAVPEYMSALDWR